MKRIASFVLCLTLLITSISQLAVSSLAAESPTITCTSKECNPGDTVSIEVNLSNNPGIMYLEITPTYSAELGSPTVQNGSIMSDLTKGKQYVWTADEDVSANGNLLTMTFTVNEFVAPGNYAVGFIFRSAYNYGENLVTFTVVPATVTVKAKPVPVTGIALDRETASIGTGETLTLTPIFSPETATNKNVAWSSSDNSVATVKNGVVTPLKKGTATITVTTEDGNFSASCVVTVNCSHLHTTEHSAEPSTCIKHGHRAYTVCDDCGEITEGSDAELPLSGHTGGTATCVKKAVCDVCHQEYGDFAAHNYIENASEDYLKTAATCGSKAVYYKSCSVCGLKSEETFETGEYDYTNHVGETYLKNQKEATCYEEGYTGDTYCLGCGTLLSKGTVIVATGHTGVVTKEAKAPTCTEAGWTEEIRCSICDEILQPSEPIAALGHSFTNYISDNNATCTENGTETAICDRCDATDTREIENSAFGHDYHEKRVEPGYSHEGMIQQVCARCDDVSSSVSIPALIIEETLADVANGQWFTPYIAYCLDTELMKGQGDKDAAGREYFRPENSMTRAELVTVLYNMEGQPPAQFEAIFDDVTSEKWFATQVTWASQNGLVFGTADKIFEPDTPISRQDLATILYRYAVDYKGIEMNVENVDALLGAFSDADRVGNYAKVAMAAMNQAGVITGDGDRLKPQENATRAEVASMLSRYLPNVLQADQTNG